VGNRWARFLPKEIDRALLANEIDDGRA